MTFRIFRSTLFLAALAIAGAAFGADKPAAPTNAKDAGLTHVATCKDGKEYYNATGKHNGACARHGGVAKWADGSPVRSKGGVGRYE